MVTIPGWVLAVCLYLAFNLGFLGEVVFRHLEGEPRWKPYDRKEWALYVVLLISPVPMAFTMFAVWDRILLAYRCRRHMRLIDTHLRRRGLIKT